MINYRLLRDNKESGPYSEEEMIAKGFKPYDLLWAEGKSAGWQYPSEIAAFKKYAPIIEEQPYDRFYKKQPAQQVLAAEDRSSYSSFSSYQSNPVKENNQAKEILPLVRPGDSRPSYDYNTKDLPARHIHVTLPSGNTVNLTTLVSKKENKEAIDNNNGYVQMRKEALRSDEQKQPMLAEAFSASAKNLSAGIITATTTTTASEPLVYQSRQTGFSMTLIGGAIVGIATMVGLGIMIGLSINRDKNEAAFNAAITQKTKQVVSKPLSNSVPVVPVAVTNEIPPVNNNTQQQPSKKELIQHAVVKSQAAPETIKESKTITPADKTDKAPEAKNDIVQNTDLSLQHRNAPVTSSASMIEKKLGLHENDFKTGAFGGISDLKLTLVNGSSLPLESVQVEIDYILANKKVYKTETILFKDIAAGAQATVDAPASSRGIKVNSRITKINAKEPGLSSTAATVKS